MSDSGSVAVLRARLADISSNIIRQRKVLEDLERSRTDTLHLLNTMLDPIARLPVEISSEIFVRCLPDSDYLHPSPTTAPLLLLHICTAWANIARSTPALWDTIHVDSPCAEGFERLFGLYLARAKSRGLAVTLGDCTDDMFALLCAQLETYRTQQPGSANTVLPATSVHLRALRCSPSGDICLLGVLRMLRAAPRLVECTLINGYLNDPCADSVTLPCLQSLSLGEDPYVSDIHILKYLSLPALRHLTILDLNTAQDEVLLMSFLTRLEAPLQSLRVDVSDWQPVPDYTRLVNLVPTLTCLWLTWDSASECMSFFTLLKGSPLLPHLCDLTVLTRHLDESNFHPLYDFLSARRSQMESFRFFIDESYNNDSLPLQIFFLHFVS
ncbi:hypothetical protein C8J57DRAFT_733010 [Mycena rebaudengoi]|nr:hypothetical protein C8J57DRAFT_733010 [Mycena rebaudengoi]